MKDPYDYVYLLLAVAEGSIEPEEMTEALSPALRERLFPDIAATLTVYDEHVEPGNRGLWRDRLATLVGHDQPPQNGRDDR